VRDRRASVVSWLRLPCAREAKLANSAAGDILDTHGPNLAPPEICTDVLSEHAYGRQDRFPLRRCIINQLGAFQVREFLPIDNVEK